MIQTVDLTGGEVKVIGNRGDNHTFRLSNPVGQEIIATGGIYEAEFVNPLGTSESVVLDVSEVGSGVLSFPIIIKSGEYKVRRMNPVRTILTALVEVR
jgi:hypothetical protein